MSIKNAKAIIKSRNNQSELQQFSSQNIQRRPHTYDENEFLRKTMMLSISECADQVRVLYQKNYILNNEIKRLNDNNLDIKNFITKISCFNREKINIANNKRDESKIYVNVKNLKLKNIAMFVKTFNEKMKNNISVIKEDIKISQDKYYNTLDLLNNNYEDIKKLLEEAKNYNFVISNKLDAKNYIIDDLKKLIDEYFIMSKSERFLNDDINQYSIDKFLAKCLDNYQFNLLLTSQNWNKNRNQVKKLQRKKNELLENKNILKNFIDNLMKINPIFKNIVIDNNNNKIEVNKLLTKNKIQKTSKMGNKIDCSNNFNNFNKNKVNNNIKNNDENSESLFFVFEEFEDELKNDSSEIDKFIYNLKKNIKGMSVSQNELRNLYNLPQKKLTNSVIGSPKMKTIIRNSTPQKITRNFSIENIPKLNLKQIIYNKNEKYEKYLLIERRVTAYKKMKKEKELYDLIKIKSPSEKKGYNIKNLIDIHQIKKNIKEIKKKIKRNQKIIQNFEEFYENVNEMTCKKSYKKKLFCKSITKVKLKKRINYRK